MAEWFVEGFLSRLTDPHDAAAMRVLEHAVFYVVGACALNCFAPDKPGYCQLFFVCHCALSHLALVIALWAFGCLWANFWSAGFCASVTLL